MRASMILPLCIFLLWLAAPATSAQDALGHNDATVPVPQPASNCSPGTLYRNDDGSIENGYSWGLGCAQPPYYGAWAEAYDLGPGNIACATYWFTQTGYHWGRAMDVYVWSGGVTREPDGVLYMLPGVVPTDVPYWPECGEFRFSVDCDVTEEFTLGYWVAFPDWDEWYICADENGPGGYPWTCVPPDTPYPTGWQNVNILPFECASLFIGPLFNPRDPAGVDEFPEGGPPVESPTWGGIKDLFR